MLRAAIVEIEVLGAIHAVIDSRKVDLGSRKQRALIALLALRHGTPVPIDEIIEALWENQPPGAPQSLVHTYIARLRQLMEPDTPARHRTNVIGHSGAGYQLRLPPDAVDVSRFHSHADHGLQLLASGAAGHSGAGYQLRLPPDAVDVSRFHSHADHGLQLLA
ncbi:hypothetical protein DRA43_08120, partial [Micromonospora provocatoris]